MPFIADVVTARVGHIPSIMTKVGFSFIIPLYRRSAALFIKNSSFLQACKEAQAGIHAVCHGIAGDGSAA